jgi:hypothetical protein
MVSKCPWLFVIRSRFLVDIIFSNGRAAPPFFGGSGKRGFELWAVDLINVVILT